MPSKLSVYLYIHIYIYIHTHTHTHTLTHSLTHSLSHTGSYHKTAREGAACEPCPKGMYCQGGRLPPVTRSGFWSKAEIYPQPDTVVAAACDHRNVRGVCVGFPQVLRYTLSISTYVCVYVCRYR